MSVGRGRAATPPTLSFSLVYMRDKEKGLSKVRGERHHLAVIMSLMTG